MKNKQIKKAIFIIADTLRAKNVGLYGANPSQTPNIDALGKSGIVFTDAYASITCTDPSISSIMSGKYPLSIGLVNHLNNIHREEEKQLIYTVFLPEILRKNGFKTVAIDWLGRWHKRGYDYYSGKLAQDGKGAYPIAQRLPFPLLLRILDKITTKYLRREFFVRFYYGLLPNSIAPYDTADKIVDKAIEIFNRNKQEQLFLYLHFWDAHAPHTRPYGLRSYLFDNVDDTYNAEISFLDGQIGRLIEYLKKTFQLEETLIVFTADHGENFYEHDIPFDHENLYEDVVRVPLLIKYPSMSSKRVDGLVQHVDILPTVLDLLGIPLPQKDIDGKSLMPLMSGNKKMVRDFAYFEDITYRKLDIPKQTRRRGMRIGKYKYIETLIGEKEDLYRIMPSEDLSIAHEEFYDLKNDYSEKKNLIYKKPIIAKKIKKELYRKILELNKKRLLNNPDLYAKVEKSISIIRKAEKMFKGKEIALAWTGGKDSTVLLNLVRMAFNGKIPFKVIFNDSTMEFKEIYEFIKKISKLWDINLITIKHSEEELEEFYETKDREKQKELSRIMKITAIKQALKKYKIKAFMAGIRWDEHESRSREKYFSPRSDHMRIHPILHFTEKDIWEYIKHFGVPYVDLYSKGYRSLGEKPFTKKAELGKGERSGRERDKEQLMERLRKMGYW